MKALSLIAVSLVVCVVADDAARKEAKAVKEKCRQEAGATEADLIDMRKNDELKSPAAKKMMACVFTKNKIMQNGRFSKEGSMELARKLMGGKADSENKLKIAQQIANNCAEEIGEEPKPAEEMAAMIFDCLKRQAKEFNAVLRKVPQPPQQKT